MTPVVDNPSVACAVAQLGPGPGSTTVVCKKNDARRGRNLV